MRIAFCSCAKTHREPENHGWQGIAATSPDFLLLLGDLVYAPSQKWKWRRSRRARMFAKFRRRYEAQFAREDFRDLLASTPYGAIWDDHDFAWDDVCGASAPASVKANARELFDEFYAQRIGIDKPGINQAFSLEDPAVKFILLDCRSFRTRPTKNGTMLGAKQMAWLLNELDHPGEITIVASGSCLSRGSSGWDGFSREYEQVTRAFRERGKVLFLGGDIHKNAFEPGHGYHEAISSGVGRRHYGNFGLVDLGAEVVSVKLFGLRRRDQNVVHIDRESWKVR